MKKIVITFILLALCSFTATAYNQVRFVINDGITNQHLKRQIEQAVSIVMTDINKAQENNASKLEAFSKLYDERSLSGIKQIMGE